MELKSLLSALRSLPKYVEDKEDIPLRDVVVLLYIFSQKGPVSSPDIQKALDISQPKVATIAGRLKSYGVLTKFVDEFGRVVFEPTDKALELKKEIESA